MAGSESNCWISGRLDRQDKVKRSDLPIRLSVRRRTFLCWVEYRPDFGIWSMVTSPVEILTTVWTPERDIRCTVLRTPLRTVVKECSPLETQQSFS